MKNILFLHSSSDLYGASKILIYTIKALSEESTDSKFYVCLSESGPLVAELEGLGCEVTILELAVLRKRYFNLAGIVNRLVFFINAIFKLSFIVRKKKIDIVYSNTTAIIVGAFVAYFNRKKHIFHIHEIIDSPKFLKRFLQFLMKYLTSMNIMVSGAVYSNWVDNARLRKNSLVVYNGIDIKEIVKAVDGTTVALPKTIYTIGMIGRVHYWKGQNYFLEIASWIVKEIPETKFIMIGDAYPGYEYLYKELNQLKDDLHIDQQVFDLGFQPNPLKYLKDFDLLVLPSIKPDPFPTVILESMALGIPVVATNHGGALEMIDHGITGWHIPFDNAQMAAQIICLALKNKDLMNFGQRGQNKLNKEFSISSFKKNLSNAIKQI